MILRTGLNGRNKIEVIYSLTVPVENYTLGIIDWKISELKKIADIERLYIPRKDRGRGLIDVETPLKTITIELNPHLRDKEGQYPKQVLEYERSEAKNATTKNATKFKREVQQCQSWRTEKINQPQKMLRLKSKMKSMKEEKCKNKALHGQYPRIVEKPQVDAVITNKWLSSNLKGEPKELLVAAKDQAINTRNYQKVICGQQVESKCRICSQHEETVDHIASGCEILAKTEYIYKHHNTAACLHYLHLRRS